MCLLCLFVATSFLRQRFDIEEELKRAGLLYSEQELQVNARSRSQRLRHGYRSRTHRAIERAAQNLGGRFLHRCAKHGHRTRRRTWRTCRRTSRWIVNAVDRDLQRAQRPQVSDCSRSREATEINDTEAQPRDWCACSVYKAPSNRQCSEHLVRQPWRQIADAVWI